MNQVPDSVTSDSDWKGIYRVGGMAAMIAGVLFRRNIAAEIGLFSGQASPVTVSSWFELLQNNRLLGLTYLNIFDIVNYLLLSLMVLALFAALNRTHKSHMAIAALLGLLGIAVYLASNTAFSMLSLSDQYASAGSDVERTALLAAGQALLAINRFSNPGSHPGTGGYISLLLIAAGGILTSVVMLRSAVFNRFTAYVGILAGSFDIAYCTVFTLLPVVDHGSLALIFMPAGGLFLMIWHIMVGWRLYQLGVGA